MQNKNVFANLRDKLWNGLQDLEQVFLNGHPTQNVANYLNVSFNFVEGESLMMALKDAAVSSGSACTSATLEPSYVLRALGLSDELAHSSIRFSFGKYTTEADIDHVLTITKAAVEKFVNFLRFGICTKKVSTFQQLNGLNTNSLN
jgi:cysteine desulfurase